MKISGQPDRTPPRLLAVVLKFSTAFALLLAVSASGCCCLPCGPCGYGGCLPYEAGCLPAPNSYAVDYGAPGYGLPGYAVPGCDCAVDVMPGCEVPLAGDCGCCPPVMTASACDGFGTGCAPKCQSFPILRKLFCGWWLPRCPPYVADPYAPTYYCDGPSHVGPAIYEEPIYGGEIIHEGGYHGPAPSAPLPSNGGMPAPTPAQSEELTPMPNPTDSAASYAPRQWQPSGVRPAGHQVPTLRAPMEHAHAVRPQTVHKPTPHNLRQQHAAWQPPPRW